MFIRRILFENITAYTPSLIYAMINVGQIFLNRIQCYTDNNHNDPPKNNPRSTIDINR